MLRGHLKWKSANGTFSMIKHFKIVPISLRYFHSVYNNQYSATHSATYSAAPPTQLLASSSSASNITQILRKTERSAPTKSDTLNSELSSIRKQNKRTSKENGNQQSQDQQPETPFEDINWENVILTQFKTWALIFLLQAPRATRMSNVNAICIPISQVKEKKRYF